MKTRRFFSCLPAILACAVLTLTPPPARAQEKFTFPAPSPKATLKARAGLTDIEIEYSRPGVKGREIFGSVVPWGQVWRTGANESTKITFSTPVNFGGKDVPAGKYALYTIPGQNEWTVILSSDTTLWGAVNYKPDKDAVRVTVKPVTLPYPIETFTLDMGNLATDSAVLRILWDKTDVRVPLTLTTTKDVLAGIEKAVAAGKPMAPQFYSGAAMFYLAQNKDLPTALKFISQAIEMNPKNFRAMRIKAEIQTKLGDKPGAIASYEKANEVNKASAEPDQEEIDANLNAIKALR
ncbi:hypothetical protein AYO41_01360 [Verrucomicrobia bacterium SCGC AG-212-E04]|nr:hypothetical protein AYO41_01360 [Verrucomicrobia bacterium SCGC AG-212-E04]